LRISTAHELRIAHFGLRGDQSAPTWRSLRIDLGFLGKGRYDALIVRDRGDNLTETGLRLD